MQETQLPQPQAQQRTRRPRLCGRCKCPGHQADRCCVVEVLDQWDERCNDWQNMEIEPWERFAIRINNQANRVIREYTNLYNHMRQGPYKFREHYIRDYLSDPANADVSPTHIPRVRKCFTPVSTELRITLLHKRELEDTPVHLELDTILMDKLKTYWDENYDNAESRRYFRRRELAHNRRITERRVIAEIHRQRVAQQDQIHYTRQHTPTQAPTPAPPQFVVKDKVIEETSCAICLEDLTPCNNLVAACGHQFHASCIMKMVESTANQYYTNSNNKGKCPCCRSAMYQ
jgi:hypothetical protein